MGGLWSGRRWSKKPVVEDFLAIDTADLKRQGTLVPGTTGCTGTLHWTRGGERHSSIGYTVTVGERAGTFRPRYAVREGNETFDYPVALVATPCHLGGARWWFRCPLAKGSVACGRRVKKLYLRGTYFGCRHCHGLTYTSTQESDSRVYAVLRADPLGTAFADPRAMSVRQLGFALKVLSFQQKRLDRWAGRSDG